MSFQNITGGFVDDTQSARTINPKAVLFQLGLMSAISLGTLLAFEILRPANKVCSIGSMKECAMLTSL